MPELTAAAFIEALTANQSDEELRKIQRYFKSGEGEYGEGDRFIGVRMGSVFALAKDYIDLPPSEIEALLDSDVHEARAGALSIMAKQAARTRRPNAARSSTTSICAATTGSTTWDLVDLAARDVIGLCLLDRPRDVLYRLAASPSMWERRTAITATAAFLMKRKEVDDIFAIAELLLNDPEDLIHKATGGWLRLAGDIDRARLNAFLDAHAASMPRVMLRYAIEHFDGQGRQHYMGLKTR